MIDSVTSIGTIKMISAIFGCELLAAYSTVDCTAFIADEPMRLSRYKRLSAFFTSKMIFLFLSKVNAFIAKIGTVSYWGSAFFALLGTFWASFLRIAFCDVILIATGANFVRSHSDTIPHLQRMADAFPGIEIERL